MHKFTVHTGLVAPLDQANVDTDAIIPKQYLKSIRRTGFGQFLFDEARYLRGPEPRALNPTFVLNLARYHGASILLTRANFGCGSSREHAVWAVEQFGFKALIAPSFADIFSNNCLKNGVLPVVLPESAIEALFELAQSPAGCTLTIDLPAQTVSTILGVHYPFDITPCQKQCLLNGVDEIQSTLSHIAKIEAFERASFALQPWNKL